MIQDEKRAYREKGIAYRESISEAERAKRHALIDAQLFASPLWAGARRIFLYFGVKSEVRTGNILKTAWSLGKETFLPRVEGKEMLFYKTDAMGQLKTSRMGIPEPSFSEHEEKRRKAFPHPIRSDLILLPGTAFDAYGHRIGYGAGYYDKFFEVCELAARIHGHHTTVTHGIAAHMGTGFTSVGVCFAGQMFECLPHEETDIPVSFLLNEKGLVPARME